MAVTKVTPKIIYGLRNVHYAVMSVAAESGAVTYGKPEKFPGSVSLALSPDGEVIEFYADDIVYYGTNFNNGYIGDLETALVPDKFLTDVLGYEKSKDGGLLYEVANVEPKHVAILGEFATDAVAKRTCFYDVLFGRPDINRKTKEKTITPQTQKMSVTIRPIEVNEKSYVKYSTTPDISEEAYNTFFSEVKLPTAE